MLCGFHKLESFPQNGSKFVDLGNVAVVCLVWGGKLIPLYRLVNFISVFVSLPVHVALLKDHERKASKSTL